MLAVVAMGSIRMGDAMLGRFGDKRLADVGDNILAAVQSKRTMCLHRLAEHRNQTVQFGRFLANPAVTAQEMLGHAGAQANQRAAGRDVLAIMDTTDLRFANHEASKRGFGRDANDTCPGLFLHPVLAIEAATGGVLGLVDCTVLNRIDGRAADHKKRAAEDKESQRWLAGAEQAAERLPDAARITMVGDRESDIYDLFARRPAHGSAEVHLLCRSAQARALTSGGLLPAHCDGLPEQGRETIEVPPKGNQPARKALVALRFDAVTLKRPVRAGNQALPEILRLYVVDVREIDAPSGAEPVHWRLLTTHALSTLDEARQIVAWYRQRWIIEQVFRSLKSHCLQIEESQMVQASGFIKLAVIGLIAAVRAMQLVLARDGSTGQPITDAVGSADLPALREINASLEGRTAKLRNPYTPADLAWLAWIVARLGGWSGYRSRGYKPAGPKTMHHGLIRLDQILIGWRLANRSADV
jgi:hypothetical protein